MTKIQKILMCFLLTGFWGLGYIVLFCPPVTPELILNRFVLSARYVMINANTLNRAEAQKQAEETLRIVRRGISLFPDRLDLRLGEIHFCELIGDSSCMTKGMAAVLEQAQINNHKWQWNKNGHRGKNFMLSRFQVFLKNLWLAGEDSAFQKTAGLILSYYPDNVMNLDNLGVFYLAKKEYAKAGEYLEKAHLLAPWDKDVSTHLNQLKTAQKK